MLRCIGLISAAIAYETCALHVSSQSTLQTEPQTSYDNAVYQANAVSELSNKINAALLKLQRLQSEYDDANRYYAKQKRLLDKQIEIRKRMVARQSRIDDATHRADKEEHFKSMMCWKFIDAFVNDDDKDARLKVLHICMGRKSVSLLPTSVDHRLPSEPRIRGHPAAQHGDSQQLSIVPLSLIRQVGELEAEIRILIASERRFQSRGSRDSGPSQEMKQKLQQLDLAVRDLKAKIATDKAQWRKEVDELREEERGLANDYYGTHYDREAAEDAALDEVKDNFCPVIEAHYGVDHSAIVEHVVDQC